MTICLNAEEEISVDNMVDSLEISVKSTDENVDVNSWEIENFHITNSK